MLVHADLHMHSIASDGEAHPRSIIRRAKAVGLSVISITDHDTFAGSVIGLREDAEEVLLVPGAEIRTFWGDVLVLCPNPIPVIRDPYKLRGVADNNNCVLIPAHPFDIMRLGVGWRVREPLWDSVECFNMGSDPVTNAIAATYCRLRGVKGLANSDAHVLRMVGGCRTLVDISELSVDEVLESIRKGRLTPRPGYSITGIAAKFAWALKRRLSGLRRPRVDERLYLKRFDFYVGSASPSRMEAREY